MAEERLVRRGRGEEKQEDATVTVAKALAPQLGSDPKHLGRAEIDQRKFAVLNPYSSMALNYFNWRGGGQKFKDSQGKERVRRGVRFYRSLVDWELNASPSEGGLGRRQAIKMVAAAAGVGKGVIEVAERPNVAARNLWRRDWKKQATEEGKVIP